MIPVLEKLKIDRFTRLATQNIPDYLKDELASLGSLKPTQDHDAILAFTTSNDDFFSTLESMVTQDPLIDQGVLLLCYPKKGNPTYPSHVHRDEIFPKVKMDDDGFVYGSSYKFNRMLAFDDNFTILEIKKVEHFKLSNKPSVRGSDFVHHIPDVKELLKSDVRALAFYNTLSPGYQKDWAVYIFSTATEATRLKRIEETKKLLAEGHKNMTLYRQSLKK